MATNAGRRDMAWESGPPTTTASTGPAVDLRVSEVAFSPAPEADQDRGLLGWVSFVINDALSVNGVAVRRTRDGRFVLSYPARPDAVGNKCFLVRPRNDRARRHLERAVLGALGQG